ncbi:hypothetical protein BDA99DRAFT_121323 [Phascolomyces articulosus]|uniref:RNI-like protein n=1 Tax=Phascolomyces articulosus TaxID=60185 RepID=A0AAD5PJ63_9FUNG|nr:hypothetical protein BDA99DRAFT_121323 [Phascolomyces articulosus]
MVVAFWQTRYTLTMLNLDFSDRINVLGLADIIFTCINLAKLSFTTTLPLVSFIGNFSTIKQHDALIDLKINAKRITGQDIELMLKRCHKLRRLIMHTCDTSVFDAIHKYTPRLEILGYNPDRTVPELEDNRKGKEGGLRMLYTNNGKTSVRAASILPVIYKSQATLETLNAILSSANILQLHELYTTYPDFELSSIKHMTFWGKSGIQQFLLRSIRNTTTLTKLHAINVHDVEGFVNGIFHLSSISRFSLSYTKDMVGHPSLARLLQKYATKSEESSSTPASSLTFLRFRYCTPILDDLLLIVASIKTLQELDLRGLTNISTDGINIMINKFSEHRHQQLKKVELYDMDCIRDSTLVALGQLKNLTYLHIKDLKNVSDEGISAIVETVEEGYLDLDHLCVERCPKVTQASINHAKQKINVVKYNK